MDKKPLRAHIINENPSLANARASEGEVLIKDTSPPPFTPPRGARPKSAEWLLALREHRMRYPEAHPQARRTVEERSQLLDALTDLVLDGTIHTWQIQQVKDAGMTVRIGGAGSFFVPYRAVQAYSRDQWLQMIREFVNGKAITLIRGGS